MAEKVNEPRDGFVAVGRLQRAWGLEGEVKAESMTDFPERFEPGARLWVNGEQQTIERGRTHKGEVYLKFAGFDTTKQADALRGALLEVPETELAKLPEGDYYHFQLEGLNVVTTEGDTLGAVAEVLEPGANAVLVVHGERGEVLVPFIEDVIRRVDLDARVIEIELIENLLPDAPRPPRERPPSAYSRRKARQAAHAAFMAENAPADAAANTIAEG